MTLGDAKEKVLCLLDEGIGSAAGIRFLSKMNNYFDAAQREAALAVPIIKTAEVTVSGGMADIPADAALCTGLYSGHAAVPFTQAGDKILADDGQYVAEYRAIPADITQSTPDTTKFELCDAAAQALPFYVAALCVLGEDAAQYSVFMDHYSARLEGAKTVRVRVVV